MRIFTVAERLKSKGSSPDLRRYQMPECGQICRFARFWKPTDYNRTLHHERTFSPECVNRPIALEAGGTAIPLLGGGGGGANQNSSSADTPKPYGTSAVDGDAAILK